MISKILIISIFLVFASCMDKIPLPGRMYPWQCLHLGDTLRSSRGCYWMTLENSGNLVVRSNLYSGIIWETNTSGQNIHRACLQGDGNFVLEKRNLKPGWASGSHKNPGSILIMQDDGNVVIYKYDSKVPAWASGRHYSSC
jgi:hypothetical protein